MSQSTSKRAATWSCLWVVGQLMACVASTSSPAHGGSADGGVFDMDASADARARDSGPLDLDASPDAGFTLLRSTAVADTLPSVSDSDYATFISNINKFGLDLGQAQAASNQLTQGNLVYSPLSATLALAMTYGGARTQTAAQMKSVLGDTFSGDTYHAACNRLMRELQSRASTRTDPDGTVFKVELNLADSIFVERTLTVHSEFLDLLGRDYDSGVRQVDFIHAPEPSRQSINQWVADQTHDKILDLVPQDAITTQTRIALVNALYFYGSWATPFPTDRTTPASFQPLSGAAVEVPTMHTWVGASYRMASNFEVAELPYTGDKLRMTIVLPAAGLFESVRSQLTAAWLEQAVTGLQSTQLAISMPKLELTSGTFSLTKGLQTLGMTLPFLKGQSDFSGITTDGPLYVTDVLQKAFIGVDEHGTQAAAATAVLAADSGVVQQLVSFVVDRPFLFFIRDASGVVLFSGQVVDPSA